VNYTSPSATGTLTLTPAAFASGTATITVTVNNGGASNNITSQNFVVTVNPVNQSPTLNAIASLSVNENAGLQTVQLAGISSGTNNASQTVMVSAVSSNPALIPAPVVNYTSPSATGTLTLTPAAFASGTATITVTVNNGGASNNITSQNFVVTVNPVNQPPTLNPIANYTFDENVGSQTIQLTGITSGTNNGNQKLTITAVSSNSKLIQPSVTYTSPSSDGTLTIKPPQNTYGVACLTVTVNNGGQSNNVISRSFAVIVLSPSQASTLAPTSSVSANGSALLLDPTSSAGGQFSFTVVGQSGSQYVVQASSDLVNWIPLMTNASPFTMVDTNAGALPARFYQAILQ
jgi:hypothetical protein